MGLRKNILRSWGERSFFFQGAGSKDPPGGASLVSLLYVKYMILEKQQYLIYRSTGIH